MSSNELKNVGNKKKKTSSPFPKNFSQHPRLKLFNCIFTRLHHLLFHPFVLTTLANTSAEFCHLSWQPCCSAEAFGRWSTSRCLFSPFLFLCSGFVFLLQWDATDGGISILAALFLPALVMPRLLFSSHNAVASLAPPLAYFTFT